MSADAFVCTPYSCSRCPDDDLVANPQKLIPKLVASNIEGHDVFIKSRNAILPKLPVGSDLRNFMCGMRKCKYNFGFEIFS